MKIVTGLYDSVKKVDAALLALDGLEYTGDDISIIVRDDIVSGDTKIENDTMQGVKDGIKKGGVVGGVVGLLVGVGFLTIPGVGALFIAGPIAAALGITGVAGATASGALTGVLAGGLIAGLKELGYDEVKAKRIEDAIKDGSIMIGVRVRDDDESKIRSLLDSHGADDVDVLDIDDDK